MITHWPQAKIPKHSTAPKRKIYRKLRSHSSPFTREEQFYLRMKLNYFALKTRIVVDPAVCVKDSVLLSAAWASVSLLSILTLASVVGGKMVQNASTAKCPYNPSIRTQPQVTLSIIIPTYNASHSIVPALLSLYKGIETSGISAEIIIVDANSTDSTCDIIHRLNTSWKDNGLLSCIEEGKTGLEGVKVFAYTGDRNIGLMLHHGYLGSSGSFVLFSTQDLMLPDDYPSLIHQALSYAPSSTASSSGSNALHTIEIGCFLLDPTPPTPAPWLKPLLLFSNFKTYYLSIPSIDNAIFMKSQTYMRIGGLGLETLFTDENGKESICARLDVDAQSNTLALFIKELHSTGRLVIVDTPVKVFGQRWFMNPIMSFNTLHGEFRNGSLSGLSFVEVVKAMFRDHIAYFWSLFWSA